jgi:phosphate transport system permease protein
VASSHSIALQPRRTAGARRRVAAIGWGLSIGACLVALGVLVAIFGFVFVQGVPPLLRISTYTTVTNGVSGGLANAIVGTVFLVAGGVVLAAVIGVSAGICTAEYAPRSLANALRFTVDVLAGVPSIVVGYFGYVALVVDLGWHFSLAAGAFALAIIMLPYVVRATDLAFSSVPASLREGAYALGARRGQVLRTISTPYAMTGTLTGLILGTGIAIGETAPLIYTAGWSNYLPSIAPTHSPVGYLTYVVWTFIGQPFPEAHQLAYGAAVLLMIAIFFINVVARVALHRIAERTRGRTRG